MDSVWFDLEERFDEWQVSFDAWQDGLGQILLGLRDDGKYATTVGGSTVSIPRQVAKTFIISRATFALATEFDGLTALWTAHRIRTATQTFQKLAAFAQSKRVKPYLLPNRNDGIRSANGEQEIRFRNGSVIMFGAREQGFGRGFDEVDIEVFDEAQILTEKALEDMVPAANQSRNPHGALLIYMGTPPRPTDPGEVFTARRRKALAAKPNDAVSAVHGDAFYVECSADPDTGRPDGPSIDDMDQVRKANPSYPHRTPPESIARMRENLTSDDAWRREALGIWDEETKTAQEIPPQMWSRGAVKARPALVGKPVVAVDFRAGLEQAVAVAVAAAVGSEVDFVDIARYESGVDEVWARDFVVDEAAQILARHGLDSVAVDGYGEGNGALIPMFEARGIRVVKLNTSDMRNGAVGLKDFVVNGRIRHPGNEFLDAAVKGAGVRKSKTDSGFVWSQNRSSVDITTLRAVTAAWWVLHVTRADSYDPLDSAF